MCKWIFFALITTNVYSQNSQIYSGEYNEGVATYDYYENKDLERIYNGKFEYTQKAPSYHEDYSFRIEGKYKENLKDGKWTYSLSYVHKQGYTKKESLVGQYMEGKMEGVWKYEVSMKYRGSDKEEKVEITANFSNNNFSKEYQSISKNIFNVDNITEVDIRGQFSDNGLLDSLWVIKFVKDKMKFEARLQYKEGILYYSLIRNLATGDIIEKVDSSAFVEKYFNNFDASVSSSQVNNRKYRQVIYKEVVEKWTQYNDSPKIESIFDFGLNKKLSNYLPQSLNIRPYTHEQIASSLFFWNKVRNGCLFKIEKGSFMEYIKPESVIVE